MLITPGIEPRQNDPLGPFDKKYLNLTRIPTRPRLVGNQLGEIQLQIQAFLTIIQGLEYGQAASSHLVLVIRDTDGGYLNCFGHKQNTE